MHNQSDPWVSARSLLTSYRDDTDENTFRRADTALSAAQHFFKTSPHDRAGIDQRLVEVKDAFKAVIHDADTDWSDPSQPLRNAYFDLVADVKRAR